jgi:hypothetical protein
LKSEGIVSRWSTLSFFFSQKVVTRAKQEGTVLYIIVVSAIEGANRFSRFRKQIEP